MNVGFNSPALLWFLLLLIPLTLLYVYLVRRVSRDVPSIHIWKSTRSSTATVLHPPLKRFLEWMFATLFLCSSVFAAAGFHLQGKDAPRRLIVLLDNSSSMTRPDPASPERTLLEKSVSNINRLLRKIPHGTPWTVVRLAPVPRVIDDGRGPLKDQNLTVPFSAPLRASGDRFEQYISSLSPPSSTSESASPGLLCFTDRQIPNLSAVLERFEFLKLIPAGGAAENMAITRASLDRNRNGRPVRLNVRIQNFSSADRTFPVRFHGMSKKNLQVELPAEATKQLDIRVQPGTKNRNRLGLIMDTNDPFPRDDGAYFFRQSTVTVPVELRLPSGPSEFVRSAIAATGPPFVLRSNNSSLPDNEEDTPSGEKQSFFLVTDQPPPSNPPGELLGTISFTPTPSGTSPADEQTPPEVSVHSRSPLTDGLAFDELRVERYAPVKPDPEEVCLLSIDDRCIAVRGTPEQSPPYVRFNFSLSESNLVMLPEFPLLLERILSSFTSRTFSETGKSTDVTDHTTGTRTRRKQIRTWLQPDGSTTSEPVPSTGSSPFSVRPGWYRNSTEQDGERIKTVNFFFPEESRMNREIPGNRLITNQSELPSGSDADTVPLQNLLLYLAAFSWIGFLVLSTR